MQLMIDLGAMDALPIEKREAAIDGLARGLARRTDPDSAHAAADAVTPGVTALEALILSVVGNSPATAFDIAERVDHAQPHRWDESTVRTRVSALGKRGALVKCVEKGVSPRGRTVDVWRLP